MKLSEKVKIVSQVQRIAYDVFLETISMLHTGMSEVAIAEVVRVKFAKRGIKEFWYNVPQAVTIGIERFRVENSDADYVAKSPSNQVCLEEGSPLFIDLSPIDSQTKVWGDWASMIVFYPRKGIDEEQVEFLKEFREIQRVGISQVTASTTGAEVADYYLNILKQKGITLLDARNNVGHSIHEGPKENAERVWLDFDNNKPLGEGVFTVEPGGFRRKKDGKGEVIARFEDCIYIPPSGNAVVLGNANELPFIC